MRHLVLNVFIVYEGCTVPPVAMASSIVFNKFLLVFREQPEWSISTGC